MDLLLFALPSLLVAAAYLMPEAEPKQKTPRLPAFAPMCGCKQ